MASSKSDGVTRLPIHARLEASLEAWGHFAVRHRRAVLLGSVLATALLVSTRPSLRIDNSVESNFRPNDPEVVVYNS